jgi:hypothetical protein
MVMMQLPESGRSPALTNGHGGEFEQEWTEGLKLSDTFTMLMNKSWKIKDQKQRTSVSPKYFSFSLSQIEALTCRCRELLLVLGQKYTQYNDVCTN